MNQHDAAPQWTKKLPPRRDHMLFKSVLKIQENIPEGTNVKNGTVPQKL
jgi:hypothetical protein